MKKNFILIIALVLGCLAMDAAQLTPMQKKAKTEIYNALKKYCTNIKDEDETLQFQYSDAQYYANINVLNSHVLYLSLVLGFNLPEEYNSEIANKAALNAAADKPVCSYAYDGTLMFTCEMYTRDVKSFIAVIPEMLQALNSSAEKFQEEYDKVASTYTPSKNSNIVSLQADKNVYIYPKVLSKGDSRLHIEKVTLSQDYTVLDMASYNGREYQWCSISKNSYISVNGKRYTLIRANGIAYSPQHTDYPKYDSGQDVCLRFRLYFPTLPKGTTSFDFSEGSIDGWQIKGVELKHGNVFQVNGETNETAYHTWNIQSVEVQDGQTIVTKTVKPKSEGTYMYSSQNEYLEDADCGRKYYLVDSSIGFEGSPEISYNTNTITFYEVYPALPLTVKSINVSSGSNYYVKGLKIR